jgi:hypothetical protein
MKNELLTPNGKPSKLNATQYELVRTPAFKKWFGDWENDPANASKVVDENGEPLVVYHGTMEDFSVFLGGSYFTDDYMNADGYASGEIVLETFLNIKKPLVINARGRKWDNLKNKYGTSTREIVSKIDEKKYDGVIFYNINDNWFDDENGEPQNVYFTINPNQIKLSDGTNITFDLKNDDIRFAKGGKTKGDCYLVAGQIAMEINKKKIDYKGTPYLVHAEVKHSTLDGVRFGHAFIEDDENVYDFSNNREIVLPKQLYYYFGDINPKDKKKYRKYTFKEATKKMVSTGNYGCWDIDVKFNSGGEIVKSHKREIPDYLKMFLDL